MTRLEKILDDSDSTLTWRACNSDLTKMTRAHHCRTVSLLSVRWPRHFCRVRVTRPSSQSHLKFFRVKSESRPGRVRVESEELSSHFESLVCKLESMSSHTNFHIFLRHFFAVKWHPTCHKLPPDKLENDAQHAMKWRPIS